MQRQEFFKKLGDEMGGHPLKVRLEEELKDHLEDTVMFRNQNIVDGIERLGSPQKISKHIKSIDSFFYVNLSFLFIAFLYFMFLVVGILSFYFHVSSSVFVLFGKIYLISMPFMVGLLCVFYRKILAISVKKVFYYTFFISLTFGLIRMIFLKTMPYFLPWVTWKIMYAYAWDFVADSGFIETVFNSLLFSSISVLVVVVGNGFKKSSSTKNPPMVGA
jgi:hypothetical protein